MEVKPLRARTMGLFAATFGAAPRVAASAPGRVTLLGELTHYAGGPVLSIATRERLLVAAAAGEAGVVELVTPPPGRRERRRLEDAGASGSLACIAAVLRELVPLGAVTPGSGARAAVTSDLPAGDGFAWSAAFAVALAKALGSLDTVRLTARQLLGVAFRAERDRVGPAAGVMDYAVAALARADHALLVESTSADTREVPFATTLLLVDTGVRREWAAGLLERRGAECASAVARLRFELPELIWLASWPAGWIVRLKKALPEPLRSRALHVVGEAARARYAGELLRRGRMKRFGELLYESHESSRRLYEWTAPDADLVVAAARRAGALGARLTGLGPSGQVVVLPGSGESHMSKVTAAIQRALENAGLCDASIRVVRPGGGVRREGVV